MRFLCVADLHLGAGGDYGAKPGDRLADQERILAQITALVHEQDVEHVLIVGDVFHRPRPAPAELLAFQRFLDELDCSTTIISGNHDVASAADPNVLELYRREFVAFHATPAVMRFTATVNWPDVSVAVLPWTPPARMYGQLDEDRVDAAKTVAERLVDVAGGLRAQITDGPAVLALHWSVSGAVTSTGASTDDFREPVLSAAALEAQEWDAIVCGHIHKQQLLGRGFFYCGSPGVVDFGEASHSHGVMLLDVDDRVRGEFIPLTDRAFVTIDGEGLGHGVGLEWPDVTDAVVRVRYTATAEQARGLDHDHVRRSLLDAGAHKVYAIQATITGGDRARDERVTDQAGPGDAVDAWLDQRSELSEPVRDGVRERSAGYLEETAL